ncbi:MAG: DNA-binding transcriptional MerR regulator [Sphingobacteriales bacterium]
MPYKEKIIEKLYFTIGEVSEMFSVNTSLIRFWEKEFDVLKPKKNRKGNRLFTKDDVNNLHIIFHLVKERGFTLKGAKEQLKYNIEKEKKKLEVVKSLKALRGFLLEIKDEL